MDGPGGVLIGVGLDLQEIEAMRQKTALHEPGVMFTEEECAHCLSSADVMASFTGLFCAKEAFFKGCPERVGFAWTDLEVACSPTGAPYFRCDGELGRVLARRGWSTALSITHSARCASAVVIFWARAAGRPSADRSATPGEAACASENES